MECERMKSKKALLITLLVTGLLLVFSSAAFAALPSSNITINPNITIDPGIITTPGIVDTVKPGIITNPDLLEIIKPYKSQHETIKAVPLYRVYENSNGQHHYTINYDEFKAMLGYSNVSDDGLAGYISPVPLPYTVPMWNMVKNGTEQYFVTTEANRDYVIGKYGYADYGIMGYVVDLNDTAHGNTNMFQWYRGNKSAEGSWFDKLTGAGDPFTSWNADHYYHNQVYNIGSYNYEGPQFRVWSDASVLQEITVASPNGGETLTGSTSTQIKWNTLIPGGNVSLYYTLNPEQGWSVIAENLPNNGSYTWQVPNSATSKAIVEARWTYAGIDANCYDQSDKYFTIKTGGGTQLIWGTHIETLDMVKLLVPAAPTNLTVSSSLAPLPLSLYWKDNADNETGYVIERKTAGSAYAKLAQVGKNITKYADSSAEVSKTYFYRVKAVNSSFSSAYSNEAAGSVFKLERPDLKLPDIKTPGTTPDTDVPGTQEPGQTAGNQVSMLFTMNKGTYTVNGVTKTMDVSPISIEGRTMLPVRFVAEPLGATNSWDGSKGKVTVKLGNTILELWIGSNTAVINGKTIVIDPSNPAVKPIIMNSRTMLPMRFVTEKLGCAVEWLPQTGQIKVTYGGTWLDPQPEPPAPMGN